MPHLFQYFVSLIRSLHHLQSALPILSSTASQDQQDDSKDIANNITKDPLREFLLDQQNFSEKSENGGLAIGQIKGESRKILRQSIRNEVVGFDAIKEEDETKDVASVALKAVVTSKKSSPSKEPVVDLKSALHEQTVAENNEKAEILTLPSKEVTTGAFTQTISDHQHPDHIPVVTIEPVSSMQELIPSQSVSHQHQQYLTNEVQCAKEDTTEDQLIPPQAFIPMVPVVEEQVTQWYPLHVVCSMFRDQGRVIDLENLLLGSAGIRREDRKMIFMWTLQSYVDLGMLDRAVMLSKRLEWENLSHDFPEFHALMASLIQNYAYRLEVPIQPSPVLSMSASPATTPYTSCPSTPISSNAEEQLAIQAHYHRKLKKAISKENGAEGLAALNELDKMGKQVNVTEMSSLM